MTSRPGLGCASGFAPFGALLLTIGCTGEFQPIGVTEPVRVTGGAFRLGPLPGAPPGSVDPAPQDGPRITALESASGIGLPGQLGRRIAGRTTEDAFSIGLRFRDLGTGYWVTPAGAVDPASPGERDFALDLALGAVPPGVHALRIVAIDGVGRGGPGTDLDLCVLDPARPGDLSPCSPEVSPPAAVVVLTWDLDADLDLIVATPEGKWVEARRPTTAGSGEGSLSRESLEDPTLGVLSYDSNAECRIDGRNTESLVWREPPDEGTFLAYANLYDACGQRSVGFVMVVYRRQDAEGAPRLVEVDRRSGVIPGISANGGAGPPLYVTTVSF